ncbi:MAG: GYD domain-containing protein, partial [Akkermansiaceae bacterium]|nr:GYD domain-containing protein [Akkermansiaceae bacterium]
MKRFIALINFTDQGRRNIKESPERADAFIEDAKASGVTINALYWTIGGYDGIISLDAPDEQTATAVLVRLSSGGNVTTTTLQAFNREDIAK